MSRLINGLEAAAVRTIGSRAAPSGPQARLLILLYHRVLPLADPMLSDVDAATFDWQVALLRQRFNVLPLGEALVRLNAGTLPARGVCITFDDGYRDNFTVALPILQRYGVTATFFVATGFLDGGRMWNDSVIECIRRISGETLDLSDMGLGKHVLTDTAARRATANRLIGHLKYLSFDERTRQVERLAERVGVDLPNDLMMDSTQVRQLHAAGMEIGGHTVHHPILARLPAAEAEKEICQGRDRLCEIVDDNITLFAYPNGVPGRDYNRDHVEMVRRAGFVAAVSTARSCARRGESLFQVPRLSPWDTTSLRYSVRLLLTYRGPPAATV